MQTFLENANFHCFIQKATIFKIIIKKANFRKQKRKRAHFSAAKFAFFFVFFKKRLFCLQQFGKK
jgi:hypothetical protein